MNKPRVLASKTHWLEVTQEDKHKQPKAFKANRQLDQLQYQVHSMGVFVNKIGAVSTLLDAPPD